jgi:hypothetical protein
MATRTKESTDQSDTRRALAAAFFLERIALIPGVSLDAGMSPGAHSDVAGEDRPIRVLVASRQSESWRLVRELEGEVIDRYPRSGLRIRLTQQRPTA